MFQPDTGWSARTRRLSTGVAVFALLGLLGACGNGDGGGSGSEEGDTSPTAPVTSPTPGEDAGTDLLYFYPPEEGATLTYTNSGAASSTTEVAINEVTTGVSGHNVTATETVSGVGEPVTVSRTFRTTPNGGLIIDAAGFGASGAGTEVTATGDDVTIPPINDLESGAAPTGDTFVEVSGAGFSGRMDVSYTVSGGGFTTVTVIGNEVEAYLVEIALDIDSSFAGTVEGAGRYWIVPGFGLVRQEMTTAGATLAADLTATSIPLPT